MRVRIAADAIAPPLNGKGRVFKLLRLSDAYSTET